MIIVTGGASGMGAHFASRLHEAGARVAVGDVNTEKLDQLPDGIFTRKLDVGDEATHDGMPEQRAPDVERMVACSGDYGCTILGPPPA